VSGERQARRAALASPLGRFERMAEIRAVEERIQVLYNDGHVRGSTHLCSGQEAVAVGVAAAAPPTDVVTCTYRGHGQALALGVTPLEVIGEIVGRSVGCGGGQGGSMHLVGPDVGLWPTFAIVGAGLPVAVGAALASQVTNAGNAAITIFGDGAANIGAFHESLNLAAIWKLPVVFVCENNLYGEYTRIQLSTPVSDLADRAAAYAIPGVVVDGQDVEAVAGAVRTALDRARDGGGPSLLEMKTYRYSGHSKSDAGTYRPAGELDHWLTRDPITIEAGRLIADGIATSDQLSGIRSRAVAAVGQAAAEALAAPEPEVAEMLMHVHA
jgi:acetoin:2,6-dichlorophenolindophenol oxidoreductase subunit alpha